MLALKAAIQKQLKDAKRIALLGVGSELRGDDVAGILVARALIKAYKERKPKREFKVFEGATAPENLTGEIKRFKPTHLIIVDSADTGKPIGAITLIKPEETAGISFCTHQLPLKIMLDYLNESIGCEMMIIGIQPKTLDFGTSPSTEVKKAVKLVTAAIKEILDTPYGKRGGLESRSLGRGTPTFK